MSVLRQLVSRFWFVPDPELPVVPRGAAPALARGAPFTVVSWNIQFGAGRNPWFFYDGGPDSRVSPAEVRFAMDGIVSVLRAIDADLVLLQEVDRDSARSGFVDQHARVRDALGLPVDASTPYFKVPFVPVPPHRPLGAVDMHLSVFSRFALGAGTRFALSRLNEPAWRRAFNLRRALLHLPVPLSDGSGAHLFHTHLSAFSRGDGTLAKQVGTVMRRMGDTAGPALLAGDLNSLPPSDDPVRLGFAKELYGEAHTPIRPLWDGLDVLFPPVRPDGRVGPEGHTYVPYGSNVADRTIDYAFGRGIRVLESRAEPAGAAFSDHLPVVMRLQLLD